VTEAINEVVFGTFAYRLNSACRSEATSVLWCDGVTVS